MTEPIPTPPKTLFIFGAVGSGNTFLFNCLMKDPHCYGINEDAFGSTLKRLTDRKSSGDHCPHAVTAFRGFLALLRGDRDTLVLKTPSNLAHWALFREHLPEARYAYMIRMPHAAIASGLSRHRQSVSDVAKLWRRDAEACLVGKRVDTVVIPFETLTQEPPVALAMLGSLMPVAAASLEYAKVAARVDRSGPDHWRRMVGEEVAAEIDGEVTRGGLERLHHEILMS